MSCILTPTTHNTQLARRRTFFFSSQESDRAEDRAAMLDAVMGPLEFEMNQTWKPPFLGACAVKLREGILTA